MPLRVKILQSKGAWSALKMEENFLAERPNSKDCFLFIYENLSSVILGRTLKVEQEVFLRKSHPPVYRRLSGGGSVVHFPGNVNYSFAAPLEQYPQLFSVPDSYQVLLSALCSGFPAHLKIQQKGLSDLALFQRGLWRKISGNSQVRRKGWILQHGTFLYNLDDLSQISYWLKPPPKEPEYRKSRKHKEFMVQSLQGLNKSIVKGAIWRGFKNLVLELEQASGT